MTNLRFRGLHYVLILKNMPVYNGKKLTLLAWAIYTMVGLNNPKPKFLESGRFLGL
jgi:hypothetical protein